MFWTLTVRRLTDAVAGTFPRRFGSRPDLETGQRLVAVATEAGIVAAVSDPPPARVATAASLAPAARNSAAAAVPLAPAQRQSAAAPLR
jgi:hypothetical protein